MLPERIRSLLRQANQPGFFGYPIPASIEVSQSLINEAIAYANGLKVSKQNTIGLVINDLIWRLESKELLIDQDIKGFNLLFNGLTKVIKITVKGNIEGDYFARGYMRAKIVIEGSLKGNFIGYRMYGSGSVTVNGDITGDYAGSMMTEGSITANVINGSDVGEDMSGGAINARSIIGEHAGKEMMGGSINVTGLIKGDYAGEDMSSGSINAGSIEGNYTGVEMSGGIIKVSGDIKGSKTGHEMYGGSIIIKGSILGQDTGIGMTSGKIRAANLSKRL